MKTILSTLALVAALGACGAASAQVTSGGPDAKGNAPVKHAHTVNDGAAKRGHTSFTQGQAQRHIEHAGYRSVSGLAKGDDGVWRGSAMKNGATVQIGLDFKGNVSEGDPTPAMASTTTTTTSTMASGMAPAARTSTAPMTTTGMHHRRHHRIRRHRMRPCAAPTANGAACSGVDRNRNGISDKEDRAIKGGARP